MTNHDKLFAWAIGCRRKPHNQCWRCLGCDAAGVVQFEPQLHDDVTSAAQRLRRMCTEQHEAASLDCHLEWNDELIFPLFAGLDPGEDDSGDFRLFEELEVALRIQDPEQMYAWVYKLVGLDGNMIHPPEGDPDEPGDSPFSRN